MHIWGAVRVQNLHAANSSSGKGGNLQRRDEEMQPEQSGRVGQHGKAYSLPAVKHDHIACVELHFVLPRNQVKAKSKRARRLPKAKRINADFACFLA
jgi:hypothetical protein